MRILITGISGFAGSHLADYLLAHGSDELWGTTREPAPPSDTLTLRQVELTDPDAVGAFLEEARPDRIFHLAGQAFVPQSWDDPWETLSDNVRPALNLFRAMERLALPARLLCISSMEVYGRTPPEQQPPSEDSPVHPDSPYGLSKVAQDALAEQFARARGLHVVIARPYNHIGPRQNDRFVAPAFARQIAEAEQGLRPPVIRVGNLEARRDFSDVRDVVRAYVMLLERGRPGEAYNVGRGVPHSVGELLETLLSMSTLPVRVESDPARMRPSDMPLAYADTRKIEREIGWTPDISFEDSLRSVLDDWRARVAATR